MLDSRAFVVIRRKPQEKLRPANRHGRDALDTPQQNQHKILKDKLRLPM